MPLASDTQLGPYKILALLGAGGMGEVYSATDTRLDRKVAIKVLPEHLANDSTAIKRFEREARAIAALSHPNILDIHEFDREDGVGFVVTELLEGETLRAWISRSALSWQKALDIGIAVADGLSAAHSKGVVHRDLKPENIFITADDRVKILDFGLARLRPAVSSQEESSAATISRTSGGILEGTVPYMAPEQIRGMSADERSDIFSFGCVLHEMLTGRRAFLKSTKPETLAAILHQEPPRLSNEVPAQLDQIVTRCLRKERAQRFGSAQELLGSLRMVSCVTEGERDRVSRPRPGIWLLAGALVLFIIVAGFLWKQKEGTSVGLHKIASIAVLPLKNLSGNTNQEYLVDGMTDELIAELSRIKSLKVISRTSSMQYKEAKKTVPEIARDLDVDALVEGSVVREGDQVRITVQLIHGPTDRHLWTESYERQMQGVLALQGEVAQAIAHEIQAQLTPQEHKLLANRRSVNPAAHDAYLKAMYIRSQAVTVEEFQKGFGFIQHAAELDPKDALIQATLSRFYVDLGLWSVVPSSEAYSKAKESALRAVELDDNLADAHSVLGRVHHYYTWNQNASGIEYRRALELKPNDASIRSDYSWYLCRTGEYKKAIDEAKRAQELDPLSLGRVFWLGMALHYSRQHEEGLAQYKKVLELEPNDTQTRYQIARIYLARGQFEKAISELKKLQAIDPRDPLFTPLEGIVLGFSGKKEGAKKILHDLMEKRDRQYVRPYMLAELNVALGEKDKALDWLEKACEERDDWLAFLNVDPTMDSLRSEPRFHTILKRVGLPVART